MRQRLVKLMMILALGAMVGGRSARAAGPDMAVGPYDVKPLPEDAKGVFVEEGDFGHDGKTEIRLENPFFRIIIAPNVGGQIGSLVVKKYGNDLTSRPTEQTEGGLIAERLYIADAGRWQGKYQYAIDRQPNRVTVTMTGTGNSGILTYVRIRKSFTVEADSANIGVDYEISNDTREGAPLTATMRFANFAGGPVPETTLFFPMDNGVLNYFLGKASWHDQSMREPARGWTAALAGKSHDGVAARIQYKYLESFYTWYFDVNRPTLEWTFLPQAIDSGKSLKIHETFLTFAGLDEVSGVSGDMVGSLAVTGKPERNTPLTVDAQLCGSRAGQAEVILRACRLPGDTWTQIETRQVTLAPMEAVKQSFTWTPTDDGTYALQAVATIPGTETVSGGSDSCVLEQSVYVGKPSAAYVMSREAERVSTEPIFDPKKVNISYTSPEVVTPHVAWATPYAGGKTSAAFFLGGPEVCREVVELAERFDIDPSASLGSFTNANYDSGTYYRLLDPALVSEKYNALLAPERSYDAVVLSGDTWDHLTDFSRSRLKDMVRDGMGLVWINPTTTDAGALEMLPAGGRTDVKDKTAAWASDGSHFITCAVPFAALPATHYSTYSQVKGTVLATVGGSPLVVVGDYGKGRVVLLNYVASEHVGREKQTDGMLPREYVYPKIQYPYWEYQYGLIGRSVLWAAHHEPTTEIAEAGLPANLSARNSSGQAITLKVTSPGDAACELSARFLDQYGDTLAVGQEMAPLTLHQGANDLKVTLPPLPAGMNVAQLILKTAKGVEDWRAIALPTDSDATIAGVKFSRESYDRDQSVAAEVTLAVKAGGQSLHLEALLTDAHGHVIARQDQPVEAGAAGGKLSVEFPLANTISLHDALHLNLMDGKTVLDRRVEKFILRPSRVWDDYEAVIWSAGVYGGWHESLYAPRMKIMRDLGMTGIVQDPYNYVPAWIAAFLDYDMKTVPKGPGKQDAAASAKYGALLNMIGDEKEVREVKGAEGVALVRAWVKNRYASLDALNAEWGTDYKSWDQMTPMLTLEEALARNQSTGKMNFAPWADYRAYLDWSFTEGIRLDNEALIAGDPQGRDGASGTQPPMTKTGNNWWQLAHVFTALQDYDLYRVLRSFSDMPLTPWFGYGRKGPHMQVGFWDALFAGATGCGTWTEPTFLEPDFTLFQGAKDMAETVNAIRRGPGRLLVNCPIRFDPIAIHYSQDSLHAAFALKHEPELGSARDNMINVLVALGYQPSYIAYEQIEQGGLTPEKTKVFFMPHSLAVSDKEAEQIRAYVKAGGVVVADLMPGVMNEHCRVPSQGQLDDVFGVKRKEIGFSDTPAAMTLQGQSDLLKLSAGSITAGTFEPSLEATTAKPLAMIGSTPAVLVNSFGKGRAIYINGDIFSHYTGWTNSRKVAEFGQQAAAVEELMSSIVSGAGCRPPVMIANADGTPSRNTTLYAHDAGRSRYYGSISGSAEIKQDVTFDFGHEAYVYDLITGQAYGKTAKVQAAVGPDAVHLFAVLPYNVTGIEVKAESACQRGEPLRAALSIQSDGKPDLHVVRLEVFDPAGKQVDYYTANLLLKDGRGDASVPFALNDQAGKWTLRFRDVATGVAAEQAVDVR